MGQLECKENFLIDYGRGFLLLEDIWFTIWTKMNELSNNTREETSLFDKVSSSMTSMERIGKYFKMLTSSVCIGGGGLQLIKSDKVIRLVNGKKYRVWMDPNSKTRIYVRRLDKKKKTFYYQHISSKDKFYTTF